MMALQVPFMAFFPGGRPFLRRHVLPFFPAFAALPFFGGILLRRHLVEPVRFLVSAGTRLLKCFLVVPDSV